MERLGLLALAFPRSALLIVLIVTPLLAIGASQIGFSSDIREIFRSDSPDFAALEKVSRQYPGGGRDILLVVEGSELFRPQTLEQLRTLHLELNFIEGVQYVLSMFSARHPPDQKGAVAPLFPIELETLEDTDALQQQVQEHPLISGKLLSEDSQLALFVVALEEGERDIPELQSLMGEISGAAREIVGALGLQTRLTGAAVMRVEIVGALYRDQRVFGITGLTIGLLLCWVFLRKVSYVLLAGAPAAIAIIWLLGGMSLLGQDINVLTNVVPALVMVIAFSDALHLLFGIRRNLDDGLTVEESIGKSVLQVGPACVLTTLTTTIALLSLTLVPHPFVARFGYTAAAGTAIAYVATMSTLPALALLILRKFSRQSSATKKRDPIRHLIGGISGAAAQITSRRPRAIALAGVLLSALASVLYALTEPRYLYQDYLPRHNPAFQAIDKIEKKLAGADTLQLLIQWPEDYQLKSAQTLELIQSAHEIMEAEPLLKAVWSLHSVEKWLRAGGVSRDELFGYLEKWKSPLRSRIVSIDHNSALVIGNFTAIDASQLLPILDGLNSRMMQVAERHPNVDLLISGLLAVSAKAGYEMIGQLSRSLLAAIAIIIVLITVALRSVAAGLASILPNLLPILIGGACLYLFDKGLQLTTVVAFTIGFGIAVDDTIHVLNRYRLERAQGRAPAHALARTIRNIGPVLIVTTIVLACGMGATMFSELPMVQLFGQISVVVLTTALFGDMLFLPAIIRVIEDWRQRSG